jgi:hypothetical protein
MDATKKGGDCNDIRHTLGSPILVSPNVMYWITDQTPHESLPVRETTYRQFFRLVSPEVAVWFAKNNTRNPLGVEPQCRIVYGDKFQSGEAESNI